MLTKRMERELWLRRVDELLATWQNASPRDEPTFLRSFHCLLEAAPDQGCIPGLNLGARDRLAALLEIGAFHSAVLQVLSAGSAYMISRGPDGIHIATVVLAGRSVEATASARTGGLALAGAILLGLEENSRDTEDLEAVAQGQNQA